MPKIVVIGNCHIMGISRAVKSLVPDSEVTLLAIESLSNDYADASQLMPSIDKYDIVICVRYDVSHCGGSDALAALNPRVQVVPTVAFSAFHPDMTYLTYFDEANSLKIQNSPLGANSSYLVVFGYLHGLSVKQTLNLFREDVYVELGYLDRWDTSVKALTQLMEYLKVDVNRLIMRWLKQGAFMHTINHPKIRVLADVARIAIEGRTTFRDVSDLESMIPDDLQNSIIWACYPEIVSQLGIKGSYWFKPHGEDRLLGLDEFIIESFSAYNNLNKEKVGPSAVNVWHGNDRLIEFLLDVAHSS